MEKVTARGSMGTFFRSSDKELHDLRESELVREIITGCRRVYEFFGFAVSAVHDLRSEEGWNYLFFGNVPRTDLGLSQHGRPGDVDVLIVPYRGNELHVGKAAAIEVKRLSLRGPNWTKNTDKYGISQAEGLVSDGFPYVGLLHLIVHADGPAENQLDTFSARITGTEGEAGIEGEHQIDGTGWLASERQLRRLLSRPTSECIGLNCVSLTQLSRGEGESIMIGTPLGRLAKPNPLRTNECVLKIADFVKTMRGHVASRKVDQA